MFYYIYYYLLERRKQKIVQVRYMIYKLSQVDLHFDLQFMTHFWELIMSY